MTAEKRPTQAGPARRSVLLLGLGAVVSGCTLNNPYNSDRTPAAKAVRDLAPDVGVAVQAVALLNEAQRELVALGAHGPATGARLAGLASAYESYLAALRGAVPKGVDVSGTPTPATPAPTVGADPVPVARRTATTVHARLTGFALRAESGSFARLLGSMAAGLSQQLVVLAR